MDRFMDRQHIGLYRRLRETPRADERRKILKLLAEKRAEFKLELQNVDLVNGMPPRVKAACLWRSSIKSSRSAASSAIPNTPRRCAPGCSMRASA